MHVGVEGRQKWRGEYTCVCISACKTERCGEFESKCEEQKKAGETSQRVKRKGGRKRKGRKNTLSSFFSWSHCCSAVPFLELPLLSKLHSPHMDLAPETSKACPTGAEKRPI